MGDHTPLDGFMAEADRWRSEHPWRCRWGRVWRRAGDVWRAVRLEPVWAWQRARRGYSERDLWSLDTYIAGVVGAGVQHLKEVKHSHPVEVTEQEWDDILDRIAGPLLAYAEGKFDPGLSFEDELVQYEAAREAMRLFAEHLGSMWD
ncbi:hypothetical protein BJP40_06490 [Streptomyces sp. CC53]|uniref:hypothetical protein n=1 Tax=Streptomyces sp. CC53 TaxID=1906740 RepID=UPI0008DCE9E4|nr:hypothetical protein [Streptomyces sp. CC53]OII61171.1 hypothetical protein BJP40_06490 [Streptomyces sp. CC53]